MQSLRDWMNANPALVALLIPLVTALVGALFKGFFASPRGKAIGDLCHSIGFDPQKFVTALLMIWTGKTPPPSGGEFGSSGDVTSVGAKRPTILRRVAALSGACIAVALIAGCVSAISGCSQQQIKTAQSIEMALEPLACAFATAETDSKVVSELCKVPPEQIADLLKVLAGKQRAGAGLPKAKPALGPVKVPQAS